MKRKRNSILSFVYAVFVLMLFLVSNPYSDDLGTEVITQYPEETFNSQICASSIRDASDTGGFCWGMAAKPAVPYNIQRATNDIGKSAFAFAAVLLVLSLSLWLVKRAFLSYLQLYLFVWPRFLFELSARQKKDGKKRLAMVQRQTQGYACALGMGLFDTKRR